MSDDWLRGRASAMRREPAVFEARLWKLLRDRRLEGLKFRRQVVISRYIADFVCLRYRLIVEADGPLHEERAEHDAIRDAWLQSQGFRVLRLSNQIIEGRSWEVIATILQATKANLAKD
jgi:very-short-patch-repair endonuclease